MKKLLEEVYEIDGVDLPETLDSGMAVWTTLTDANQSNAIVCVNPASNDSRELRLPTDAYPMEVDGTPIFNSMGYINNELKDTLFHVVIDQNFGGHLEGWIHSWTADTSGLEHSPNIPNPERDERIEWDGTPQEIDSERAKRHSEVFSEGDIRGSKNYLLK